MTAHRLHSSAFPVTLAAAIATAAALAGCASTAPADPVTDRLDSQTATTVTVMHAPVELISDTPQAAAGDPFAYVAPFETDQMGTRALYLWISAPQINGPLAQPTLSCDGRQLDLQATSGDLAEFKLSRAPYTAPAPWSAQWYFKLPPESLECLGTAQGITLETRTAQGSSVSTHFAASGKALAALQAFARR